MISSIQLNGNVKRSLERLKQDNQTYEEVILKLMKTAEECKRSHEALLIESCKIMTEENLKITKEFESIEPGWDW